MVRPMTIRIGPPVDKEPAPVNADDLANPEIVIIFIKFRMNCNPKTRCNVELLDRWCGASSNNLDSGLKSKQRVSDGVGS
jgi:hypothetical protein